MNEKRGIMRSKEKLTAEREEETQTAQKQERSKIGQTGKKLERSAKTSGLSLGEGRRGR